MKPNKLATYSSSNLQIQLILPKWTVFFQSYQVAIMALPINNYTTDTTTTADCGKNVRQFGWQESYCCVFRKILPWLCKTNDTSIDTKEVTGVRYRCIEQKKGRARRLVGE